MEPLRKDFRSRGIDFTLNYWDSSTGYWELNLWKLYKYYDTEEEFNYGECEDKEYCGLADDSTRIDIESSLLSN